MKGKKRGGRKTRHELNLKWEEEFQGKPKLSGAGKGTHWFCSRGRHSKPFHGKSGHLQELGVSHIPGLYCRVWWRVGGTGKRKEGGRLITYFFYSKDCTVSKWTENASQIRQHWHCLVALHYYTIRKNQWSQQWSSKKQEIQRESTYLFRW